MISEGLYTDEHGTWKAIPGLSQSKVIVSSLGYTRLQHKPGMPLGKPTLTSQDSHGYRTVRVNKRSFRICRLVLLAFHGQPPSTDHTADHIAKYDGDFMKERGDDRMQNLRWATKSMQRKNTSKAKRNSGKISITATPVDGGNPVTFDSYNEAARELGLSAGNISNVVNGTCNSTCGWMFCINCDNEVLDGELWKEVTKEIQVSCFGRVKRRRNANIPWKPPYRVLPSDDRPYARVQIGTKAHNFHNLVWDAFGTRALRPGETIDHIDNDTTNNMISNLRPATKRQQSLNQRRSSDGTKRMSLKQMIEGRPPNGSWQRWNSQHDAADELNARLKPTGKKFSQSNISQAIRKGCMHMGWEWRKV
jgi:hypothetical protein